MKYLIRIFFAINCLGLYSQVAPSMFGLGELKDSTLVIKRKYSYDFENNKIFYLKKNTSGNKIMIEWFYEDYASYDVSKLNNDTVLLDIYTEIVIKNKKLNGELNNYCFLNGQKIFLSKGLLTKNKREGFWIKYDMYGNLFYTGIYRSGRISVGYLYNLKDGYLYIKTKNNNLKKTKGPIKIQVSETNYELMLDRIHGENTFIRY